MKETLFEDDNFERAIYHVIDGSDEMGKVKAADAISTAAENILSEAADALSDVLNNLEGER